jgi:DNA primase
MRGKIPQAFIDDLLERVDITEVIGNRVSLKRTGRNFKALCPFHQEKTPSFSVNPDKQFYYCFGCGAGGNSIGFVMEYDRLDFPAAIEMLAHDAGLQVPREDGQQSGISNATRQQHAALYTLLEACAVWFQQQLRSHADASSAITYLKERGLSGLIAKQFGIGYAPPGWDNLLSSRGQNEQARTLLNEAGMVIEKDHGGYYDRFRQRIMFPIRDTRGRVVAFGGRVLGDDIPKYLNSPETPVFNKSRELYGLYEALQANRRLDRLLIVEGYMDVVALAQHGISFAAATLGTAVGKAHLARVFRHCNKVIFCFDGDKAGRAAAVRALEATLPAMQDGRQATFLFLAESEDPDSLVRNIGAKAFLQQLETSQPIADFLFEHLARGIDLSSIDGRARLSKLALPLIQLAPDGVFKHLLLQELSQRTGLPLATLNAVQQDQQATARQQPVPPNTAATSDAPDEAPPYDASYYDQAPQGEAPPYDAPPWENPAPDNATHPRKPNAPKPRRRPEQHSPNTVEKTPLRSALATLLFYPKLAALAPDPAQFKNLTSTEGELLVEMLELLRREPNTRTHTLVGSWLNTDKHAWATALLGAEDLLDDEDKARQEFTDALQCIRTEQRKLQLEQELRELEKQGLRSPEQKARYRELLGALKG